MTIDTTNSAMPDRLIAWPSSFNPQRVSLAGGATGSETEYVRASEYDALAAENEGLRAEVERWKEAYRDSAQAYASLFDKTQGTPCEQIRHQQEVEGLMREVESLQDQCKRADEIIALGSKTIKQLLDERDQALSQLAAVQMGMRERAAVKCFVDRGRFDTPDRIRALPLDPDAEAALKRVVDATWNEAVEACASLVNRLMRSERIYSVHDATGHLRALARPTEGEQDV